MRPATIAAVLLLTALSSSAEIWFDPAAPDTRTPVRVLVNGLACPPGTVDLVRSGSVITITPRFDTACPLAPPPLEGYRVAADLGILPAGTYSVTASAAGQTIAQTSLTVRDADPAFVVQPDIGEPAGGTDVRILGRNLVNCAYGPSPPVCAIPNVSFGGVASDRVALVNGYLTARVPPHAAGTVDVRLELGGTAVTTPAAFHYSDSAAPDPAFFTPVLFPAIVTGPGAYGSVWQTDVSIFNGNGYPLPAWQSGPLVGALASTVQSTSNFPGGRLLYVDRAAAPAVSFGTVVRDRSREATDLGTEVRVVSERDLRAGGIQLLNVPANPLYRVALRAFSVGPLSPQFAYFAVYGMSGGDSIVQDALRLTPQSPQLASGILPDLMAAHPELAGKGPLRIAVSTGSSRPSAWAFVSITNNETQHVTIISPQ